MVTGADPVSPVRLDGEQPPLHPLQRRRKLPTAARELLAGFAAGAANVTSGYPFDTVKVRLQSAAPGQYGGAVDCFRTILKHEGFRRGLFRGLSSPLVGGIAETGVNYLVYSRVLDALRPTGGSSSSSSIRSQGGHQQPAAAPLPSVVVAGAVAGAALSFILGPTELVKCRMQQAGSAARYPGGPLQCLRHIVQTEGGVLVGLSRGLGATMAREVPGNALFFAVYEALRRGWLGARSTAQAAAAEAAAGVSAAAEPWPAASLSLSAAAAAAATAPSVPMSCLAGCTAEAGAGGSACDGEAAASPRPEQQQQQPDGGQIRRHWLMDVAIAVLCGGTAGTVMWAAVLPIDVAKTRLQTALPGSAWDVGLRKHWVMLWREGGVAALYTGLAPTLVRAFPANACQWLAWELVMHNLHGGGDGEE